MLVEPETGAISPDKPRTRGIFLLALGIALVATLGLHFTLSTYDCDQADLPAVELTR